MRSQKKPIRTCFYCKKVDFLERFYKNETGYSRVCLDCYKENYYIEYAMDDFFRSIIGLTNRKYYYDFDRSFLSDRNLDHKNYAKEWFVRKKGKNRYNVFDNNGDHLISYFKYYRNRKRII